MLTCFICFIAFIAIVCAASEGEWGPVAIVCLIVGFLMFAANIERKDTKAYIARRDYWCNEYKKQRRGRY